MSAAAVYGLEPQVRALCALHDGEDMHSVSSSGNYNSTSATAGRTTTLHRLLVATAHAARGSKLHLLEYDDALHSIECRAVWPHAEQLHGVWASPACSGSDGASVLATATRHTLRVLHIGTHTAGDDDGATRRAPREVLALSRDDVLQALWDVDGMQSQLLLLQRDALTLHALDTDTRAGGVVATYKSSAMHNADNDNDTAALTCAARDAHNAFVCYVGTACGALHCVDVRTPTPQRLTRDGLHGFGAVRCLDCSATTQHRVLSGGDDGDVVVHDVRKTSAAATTASTTTTTLLRFVAHEHAVCHAHFNAFHDELVLSAGADHALRLWDVARAPPACLVQLDDFGDSVVDACWSAATPWVYAGISHTGKLLLDHVPDDRRLSILLAEH